MDDVRKIYMYDNQGGRVLIGSISHKVKHGDVYGIVKFTNTKYNQLFPRITTIISSNWDYSLIQQDMISVINGMYDNLRMSCFINHRK